MASSMRRPINIIPTGSPPIMPHGTFIAGWPVTEVAQVLPSIDQERSNAEPANPPFRKF